ncbi:putative zinc finger, BED-type containing protein [Tanacetum coccineum]
MSTTQDPIVLDDSTFNPSMNQDDQVIGDEYASNEEFQTNKWKETIVDEQPKVEKTKKAKAWGEFKRVEKNGITKMKCNHCSSLLAYPKGGTTMTLNRPLEIHCSSEPDLAPAIVNRKYDHIRMQESIAHWILMHEHSFSIVEEARFNFMMKVGIPQWPGLSRTTTKNDCVKVYENQKNKLKDMLKKVDSISLTTDMWKSKCQKMTELCGKQRSYRRLVIIVDHSSLCVELGHVNGYSDRFVKQVLDGKKDDESEFIRKMVEKMKEKFDKYWAEVHLLMAIAAVFDSSSEGCEEKDNKSFNILDWWKNHESMYHILSKLARDILAIPITTVASEATFSAGTRLIDKYRAKLGVETV